MSEKECYWCNSIWEENQIEGDGFGMLGDGHWFCSLECLFAYQEERIRAYDEN